MSTKRVVDGFSIIIPTLRASLYLDFCLKSIEENSALSNEIIVIVDADLGGNLDENIIKVLQKHTKEYDITYITNRCNLGPYASWNKGAQLASKDAIAFITDDQFFAPGWDEAIAKFLTPKRLLTCQLVEPGIIRVWRTNIQCDCGSSPRDFNKVKFMNLVLKNLLKDYYLMVSLYLLLCIGRPSLT